jgi:hypothetical protein
MRRLGFETMIPEFEREKTVHVLGKCPANGFEKPRPNLRYLFSLKDKVRTNKDLTGGTSDFTAVSDGPYQTHCINGLLITK